MKKFPILLLFTLCMAAFAACDSGDSWEEYAEWRKNNNNWYNNCKAATGSDGRPFYTLLQPAWYQSSGVLIHFFNDRSLTQGNLSPLDNSTVAVKYIGRLYNDEAFDSSYNLRTNGDSIFQTVLSDCIDGWRIALNYMHVGDSAEIVIPYNQAYGTSSTSSIPPFSALKFNIKLVDIPHYETPNY